MKVLVIVAHPDDEVLGMGGTMLKHHQNGDEVNIIYLATGISARRRSGYKNASTYDYQEKEIKKIKYEIERLHKDARQSCKLLGVQDISFFEFPDNEMDSIPLLKIIKVIEDCINRLKPTRIYTNHFSDLNVDHRAVFEATLTACRPLKSPVKELISFEVPSSTEWNYPAQFNPNYFVEISKQLPTKIKAMKMYKSEIGKFPHPRSIQNLKNIAMRWGSVSGTYAAEAFEIIRKIEK